MKILFLAANPDGTSRLHLDEEVRKIEDSLRKSRLRDQFQFETKWAITASSLRQALLEEDPDIVHFSGHGEGQAGLVLVGSSDEPKPATANALSALFKLFPRIKCVLLNACYADEQARAIVQHVDYVVGMKQAIKDDAAIAFSSGFYDGLGYGKPIETAFELGCVAIQFEMADFSTVSRKSIPVDLEGNQNNLVPLPEHLIPILLKRKASFSPRPEQSFKELRARNSIDESIKSEQQYRDRVQEFLEDEKLTNTEIFQLAALANALKISERDANRIIEEEKTKINNTRSHPSHLDLSRLSHNDQNLGNVKLKNSWSGKLAVILLASFLVTGFIAYCSYNSVTPETILENEESEQSLGSRKREIISILNNYKISIHFLDSVTQLQEEGNRIRQKLIEYGLSESEIEVRGLPQSWFDDTGGLSSNQIRYERGVEDWAAQALEETLAEIHAERSFNLQTIRGNSNRSISIFLFEGDTLSRPDIKIRYYPQNDEAVVQDALSLFGDAVVIGASGQPEAAATNAVWFGSQVDLEDVKLVAEKLLEADLPIQAIRPFRSSNKPLIIEVGADRELPANSSIWTIEDVRQATEFTR